MNSDAQQYGEDGFAFRMPVLLHTVPSVKLFLSTDMSKVRIILSNV